MMKQYMETKSQYQDCILFYRLGDFYEMFFEDALTASRELEITLTGKNCGQEEKAPMCGVPYHAVEGYLNRLVAKGYKVAICEQVEDPKTTKGIVKREVVRIVTPGTNLDTQALDETKNNYIMCIVYIADRYGVSVADISTGDYFVTEIPDSAKLLDEIYRFSPSEIICNEAFYMSGVDMDGMKDRLGITIYSLESWYFDDEVCRKKLLEHFEVSSFAGLGLADYDCGIISAGALLQYLLETQKNSLSNLTHITPYAAGKFMMIDSSTRRNLELCETLREKQKRGSLLWVLDKTKTAMGARTLRKYVEQPLIDKTEIIRRLDAVQELKEQAISREEIREYLSPVYDLERLITKIAYGSANPRDLTAFRSSLEMLPALLYILQEMKAELLKDLAVDLDPLEDLCILVKKAIREDPPIAMKEGNIINDGYNEEVDKLRRAKSDGKDWLAKLENDEREKTGIKNLKIKYNKVFGYYLEVTNSYKEMVPEYYTRKQTLANAERYITPELKELEDMILGAEDKLYALEYELYSEVRDLIASQIERIQKTAKAVAALDAFASLALVAERNNYVRPKINEKGVIDIKEGRHPVVERMIPNEMFISNDTYLDDKKHRISIITGPNMAGKSTYMRQTALIALMAQVGCFVPAQSANIGLSDRIFTRVGASDDLASGQSTFMVEMNEAANILNNISSRSLVLFDELGRGTSTYDGISIAWAIVEYIHENKKGRARTLFATHYHELNEMEKLYPRVKNYNVSVQKVIFLRKLERGGSEHSFGIHVAKLAGMPKSIVSRANTILKELESANSKDVMKNSRGAKQVMQADNGVQLSFFQLDDPVLCQIRDEILHLDINNLTPMEALNKLDGIKKIVGGK